MERDAYGYPIDRAERTWIGNAFQGSIPAELQEGPQLVFPPPPVQQSGGGFIVGRWIASRWYFCRTFRPTYSRERSVPLWLFLRFGVDELRGQVGLLQAGIRVLVAGDGLQEIDRKGPGSWLVAGMPEPRTLQPIEILRAANQVHQWLSGVSGGGGATLALGDAQAWIGLQAVLSAPEVGQSPVWQSVVLRLPGESGDCPVSAPCLEVELAPQGTFEMPAFKVRGVDDHDWEQQEGWRPLVDRGVHRHGGRPVRCILEGEDPPIRLLPVKEIRPDELDRFVEEVLDSSRREQVIRDAAALATVGDPRGVALAARILHAEAGRAAFEPRIVDSILERLVPSGRSATSTSG